MFPPMGRLAETAASSRAVWQKRNRNNVSLWRRILSSLLLFQPMYNVYTYVHTHRNRFLFANFDRSQYRLSTLSILWTLLVYSIHMYTVRFNFLNVFFLFSFQFHFIFVLTFKNIFPIIFLNCFED